MHHRSNSCDKKKKKKGSIVVSRSDIAEVREAWNNENAKRKISAGIRVIDTGTG